MNFKDLETNIIDWLQQAFSKEHCLEYLEKLDEEDKKFIDAFTLGYKTGANADSIVGVYALEYVTTLNLNPKLLDGMGIVIQPITITDRDNLKFVIVSYKK